MKKPTKPTIAFLTHDWAWGTDPLQPNGCCYYRCTLPSVELNKRGWFSAVGFPGWDNERGFGMLMPDGRTVHGWDIIVLKLLMLREIYDKMLVAQEMGQKFVVDIDDWFDGLAATNRAFEATDPLKNPNNNRQIYAEIIMKADAVITSTPFLFNYYAQKRNNVYMVRNGIDSERYLKKSKRFERKPNIGWVGATHWRSNDLEQLSGFMNDYLKSNNMMFHHSGHSSSAPSAHDLLKIDETRFTKLQMTPISSYPNLFIPIVIGTIPLNNIEFNYAKSFIKGLEYAAAGVPFISSPSPEYEYLAEHGIGRVARTQDDWIYHFDELLNTDKRNDEIQHNFDLLQNFTMDKRGEDWDATFHHMLQNL